MEDTKTINSIIELIQKFPTEEECYALLEKIRWNGNVVSPFDSTSQVYKCKGHNEKENLLPALLKIHKQKH